MEANDAGIIIGAVSLLIGGILGIYAKVDANHRKQDRLEREVVSKINAETIKLLTEVVQKNTDTQQQLVEASKKNTEAQTRIADEAKTRNGHLAELQIKSQEMIDRNLKCYQEMMKEQHIESQTVDEQIVRHSIEK